MEKQCNLRNIKPKCKIAIIGGGATGVTFTHHLINNIFEQQLFEPIKITLFEPNELGAGIAYQFDLNSVILNVQAHVMNLEKTKIGNFYNWSKNVLIPEENKSYPPRHIFGKYLREVFHEAVKKAESVKIVLHHIKTEIIDLSRTGCSYYLKTSENEILKYDLVILCLGIGKAKDIYNLSNIKGYIHHPYPLIDTIKTIPKSDSVAVLGSSLTAIDIVIALIKNQHTSIIHMHSRKGYFPSVRGQHVSHEMRFMNQKHIDNLIKNKGKIRLKDILKLLRDELASVGECWKNVFSIKYTPESFFGHLYQEILNSKNNNVVQSILMATNDVIEDLWDAMDHSDKEFFLNKYHSLWMLKRSPIPVMNAKILYDSAINGQLKIYNDINKITAVNNQFEIFNKLNKNSYKWVINATGPARDFQIQSESRLLNNMLKKKYITPHPFGGLAVEFETGAVIDPSKQIDWGLRALGHITQGTYYYTSSYIMLSRRAQKSAAKIINYIKPKIQEWHDFIA